MNDCFLNLLFSFQLLLPLKDGADFVGSKQTIDVILSDLSLLGYVIPVGGLGIGLFICLLALFCLLCFSLFCLFSWGQQIFSGDYSYTCEVFLFLCF